MALLTEFLLRLTFGLAAGMAITPSRLVTSGYFRNHLYVTLGLSSLAALLSRVAAPEVFWWAIASAALSYVGSVCWLYEKSGPGVVLLWAVALSAVVGALVLRGTHGAAPLDDGRTVISSESAETLRAMQPIASGLLLGTTLAAMLLGHWYLNAPGMELAPLRRLLIAMSVAVALQGALCGVGLGLEASQHALSTQDWLFILLRWSFGLVGVLILVVLTWKTLEIPNTQSATGILYVAVMGAFVGETMSLLLSAGTMYPV
jgi:hypothetical protein